MCKIYKITSHPTVDFAAEELKKYLRMMMLRAGEGCRKNTHSDWYIVFLKRDDEELNFGIK